MADATDLIRERLKTVPNFPLPGVLFRDLTPVFAHGPSFRAVVDAMIEPFVGTFDAVAGLEARGFLLAAAAAIDAGVGGSAVWLQSIVLIDAGQVRDRVQRRLLLAPVR